MKQYANYMIVPEFNLILECCKGNTSVEDAINMKKDEIADNLYDAAYNIIVDIREFETSLDSNIAKSMAVFSDFLNKLLIRGKVAFLTTRPHQVVLSELLKRFIKDTLTIEIKIFSSPEAAIKFLGYPITSFELIKYKIAALNMNTA
jgi:hypothetical protein